MNTSSERHARIFLLSHMRAFTSLAGHILGSHPQINGYYEMHISYEDASALDKQLEVFLESDALKENSRYLFDKLLHNDYSLKPERLGLADTKILISLLEPEHTIKSIVDLFAQKEIEDLYARPSRRRTTISRASRPSPTLAGLSTGPITISMPNCSSARRRRCCPNYRTGWSWIRR